MKEYKHLDHLLFELDKRMGWTAHATRYYQLIRQANKCKCVDFCPELI